MADELQRHFRWIGRFAVVAVVLIAAFGALTLGPNLFKEEPPTPAEIHQKQLAEFSQQQSWASEARRTMLTLRGLVTRHNRIFGQWPQSLQDLSKTDVERITTDAKERWKFEVTDTQYPSVSAISTKAMPGGEGLLITLDVVTSEWQGYSIGEPPSVRPMAENEDE